jgi:hypothetical protein
MAAGVEHGVTLTVFNDRTSDQRLSSPTTIVCPSKNSSTESMATVSGPARGVVDGTEILRIVVPSFDTRMMSQSSYLQNKRNVMQVLLRTNVELQQLDTMIITGLSPTATLTSTLALSGTAAVQFGGGASYSSDGTLTFTLMSATLSANEQHTISFELQNVAYAVNSPSIHIRAHGKTLFAIAPMTKAPGDAQPLFVAGFTTRTIQQSTIATGGLNTISITFQVNRDFSYEAEAPILTIRFVRPERE